MRDMQVSTSLGLVTNSGFWDGFADRGIENRPDTSQLAKAINSGRGLP